MLPIFPYSHLSALEFPAFLLLAFNRDAFRGRMYTIASNGLGGLPDGLIQSCFNLVSFAFPLSHHHVATHRGLAIARNLFSKLLMNARLTRCLPPLGAGFVCVFYLVWNGLGGVGYQGRQDRVGRGV
jgi:hypothetical protein